MTLSTKLKELRMLRGMTQKDVALKIGISRRQYINFESGMIPKHDQLTKLNKLFKCDLSLFIYPRQGTNELTTALKSIKNIEAELKKLKEIILRHD